MSDIRVTSSSTGGSVTTSVAGEWELTVDATGENGPTPTQVLAADYASCFVPALRVGATREGFDEIVARAEERCHVHAALREELRADVSITDEAF